MLAHTLLVTQSTITYRTILPSYAFGTENSCENKGRLEWTPPVRVTYRSHVEDLVLSQILAVSPMIRTSVITTQPFQTKGRFATTKLQLDPFSPTGTRYYFTTMDNENVKDKIPRQANQGRGNINHKKQRREVPESSSR